jgi:cell shape-determining protein MreC
MMMGRSQASEMKALPALLGFACLCVVVFFAGNFQAPIRAFFAEYLTPPADAEYASLSRSEVEQRLKDAEEALERVKYQSVLYGLVVEENKNLRRVEGIESITTSVSARVLSRPPRTHYDTLIVGAGSAQGVAVHDLAMWDGVLLGEVIMVTASSATVELYSSPTSELDVMIGTPSAVAIARGLGGGAFEVMIPQGVEVSQGDTVRASTDETLLLGRVVSVSGSATDATKTVHVAAPVSMSEIDFVSIVPLGDI